MSLTELQICITNDCHVDCDYCHLDRSVFSEMPKDMFMNILEKAKNLGTEAIRLTGGDIFNHKDLVFFLEEIRKANMMTIVNISTDRVEYIMKDNVCDLCDYVLVSFQDIESIRDTGDLLKKLATRSILMGTAVSSRYWVKNLKEAAEVIDDVNFNPFFFLRNTLNNTKKHMFLLTEVSEKLISINRNMKRSKILLSNAFPMCYVSYDAMEYCSGGVFDNGFSRLYIRPNGDMLTNAYSNKILGNAANSDIEKIWNDNLESVQKVIPEKHQCRNCKIFDKCKGGILVSDEYMEDKMFQNTVSNKYLTELQGKIKDSVFNIHFNEDLRFLYYDNSDFFMTYPDSKHYKDVSEKDLKEKISFHFNETMKSGDDKYAVYIHFPFCHGRCKFCNVQKLENEKRADYVKDLLSQIEEYDYILKDINPEVVYFGGGSPQMMGVEGVDLVFNKLFSYFKKKPKEVNFEIFPEDVSEELLQVMKKHVTRVSVGVQTFQDDFLDRLGRASKKENIIKTIELIKKVGFEKLNLDFIFGLYMNNPELYKKDLELLLSFNPEHITYQPLHFYIDLKYDDSRNIINCISLNEVGRDIMEEKGYTQNSAEDFSNCGPLGYQKYLLGQKNIIGIGVGSFGKIGNLQYTTSVEGNRMYERTEIDNMYGDPFLNFRFMKFNIKEFDKKYNQSYRAMFSDSIKYLLRKKWIKFKEGNIEIVGEGKSYVDLITNVASISNMDFKMR